MGAYIIRMPDIGEGIAEVELVEWHVKEGAQVVEDQLLADVMTDKATVQIPSPVHGVVLKLGGKVGEVMAVGSELIRIEVEGQPTAEGGAAATALDTQPAAAIAEHEPAAQRQVAEPQRPEPAARAGTDSRSSAPAAPVASPARQRGRTSSRPLASPSVRRRAQQEGIDLRAVAGTGPVGQITHEDLDGWLQHGSAGYGAPGIAATGAGHHGFASMARREGVEEIPVVGLRRKIAQKMQQAKRQIPHFTYVEEIDVTELEALRERMNDRWGDVRGKLTLLPFLARAIVLAVRDFPQMNARFDDDKGVVQRHAGVHLGVAAQTDAGLMVPVLRHAESHDLWSCAREIRRLADAARQGTAQRDELSGSTITLSSLGALGGIVATPVINYPEVAIVGVNRVVERPVVIGGNIAVRKMMNLSSSFDHRVVDGMHAAQFIQGIRAYLECPSMLFVE